MKKKNKILIISNPEDEHTKKVFAQLSELDVEPLLFFPEEFGQSLDFSASFSLDNPVPRQALIFERHLLDADTIFSIWYRRPRLVALNAYSLSPEGLEFARDEWRAVLEGFYALLPQSLWISHPDALRKAARKPLQLFLARQLGFRVPQTLITNVASEAEQFIKLCNGKVIVKPCGAGWVYSKNNADVCYVLTNRLDSSDALALDAIRSAPVTFQEEILKMYEIRVNIVGQKVLAIKIESQASEISQVDWRRYDVQNTPYSVYQLPIELEQNCLRLTKALGLEFGAIDLIRQPDGEYVFLEINGNGQFLWAEELSGVEVSHALALLLAGVSPPLHLAHFS